MSLVTSRFNPTEGDNPVDRLNCKVARARRSSSGPGRVNLVLPALALASALVYLAAFTFPMAISGYYSTPHLDAPKIMGVSVEAMARFSLAVALVFLLYLGALVASAGLRSSRAAASVLGLAALLSLSVLPMYPATAGDVYAYVAEADLVLRYQANPFVTPVSAFPGHPLLPFLDFPDETTHYGPLWLVIGVLLRLLAGGDLLTALLVFKAGAAIFLLATAWLVYLTLRRSHSEAAVPAAVLVGWNPLLVFELAGNAHNDVAMMLLVALAFYLHGRRCPRLAVTALIGAVLVKYVAIVLLPLLLVAVIRRTGHPRYWFPSMTPFVVGISLAAGAVAALVGLEGTAGVLLRQSRWFTTSPTAVVYLWLAQWTPTDVASTAAALGGQALFAAFYLLQLRRVWLHPGELTARSFWTITALLLAAVSWFQPWYATWVITMAALAGTRPSIAGALGLTLGAFLDHSVMGFAWRVWDSQISLLAIHFAGAAMAWIPMAVAVALARLARP